MAFGRGRPPGSALRRLTGRNRSQTDHDHSPETALATAGSRQRQWIHWLRHGFLSHFRTENAKFREKRSVIGDWSPILYRVVNYRANKRLRSRMTKGVRASSSPHVPTLNGACNLRRAARTESAVMRPVLGLSEGMFSIVSVNRAESESTSIVWQLRSRVGSAQISVRVRSGPMPASERAAVTFTLAGKPAAASRAVPLNTHLGSRRFSPEVPWASR